MTFTFGSCYLDVRVESANAELHSGFGVYPFTLHLALTSRGFDPGTIFELSAELRTRHSSRSHWLAASTRPVRTVLQADPVGCKITFPLTNAQLLGIEEHRSGQDAAFDLTWFGRLPGVAGHEHGAETSGYFTVAASTWLRLVERVNAGVAFTIPIPIAAADGALAEGTERLLDARHHLNSGNFDDAITCARKAMERALAAAGWPTLSGGDARQRTQEQRWRAIYKAASDQASGSVHDDEVTKKFVYTRREAEALIGIAAALLKAAPGPMA